LVWTTKVISVMLMAFMLLKICKYFYKTTKKAAKAAFFVDLFKLVKA